MSARKPAPGTCSFSRPSASYESLATSPGTDEVSVHRMLHIHTASSTLEQSWSYISGMIREIMYVM